MAGKRTNVAAVANLSDQSSQTQSEKKNSKNGIINNKGHDIDSSSSISVPPVMIANRDGHELTRILTHINRNRPKNQKAYVRVKSDMIPMAVDSEVMGYIDYPKVRSGEQFLSVASQSEWAVILTQTANTKEWSIYILLKGELASPFNGNLEAMSVAGNAVVTPRLFTTNSVEMYACDINEKCPRSVTVRSNGRQVTVENIPFMESSYVR